MYCSNCGTKIKDDSNFCYYCGHKVNENVKVIVSQGDEDSYQPRQRQDTNLHSSASQGQTIDDIESYDESIAYQRKENQKRNIFEKILDFFTLDNDFDDEEIYQFDFTKEEYQEILGEKSQEIADEDEDIQIFKNTYIEKDQVLDQEDFQRDFEDTNISEDQKFDQAEEKDNFFDNIRTSLSSNLDNIKDCLNDLAEDQSDGDPQINEKDQLQEEELQELAKDLHMEKTFPVEDNPHGQDIEIDPDIDYEYINVDKDLIIEEDNLFEGIKASVLGFFSPRSEEDSLDQDDSYEQEDELIEDSTSYSLDDQDQEEFSDTLIYSKVDKEKDEFSDTLVYSKKELESKLAKDLEDDMYLSQGEEDVLDQEDSLDNIYYDEELSYENLDDSYYMEADIDLPKDEEEFEEYDYSEEYFYTKSTVSGEDEDVEIVSERKTQKLDLDIDTSSISDSIRTSFISAKDSISSGARNISASASNLTSSLGEASKELIGSIRDFFVKESNEDLYKEDKEVSNLDIQASNVDNTSDTAPLIFTEEEQEILNQAIEEQSRSSGPNKLLMNLNKAIAPVIRKLLSMGASSRVPLFIAAFAMCMISISLNIKKPLALIAFTILKFLASSLTIYLATKYSFNAIRIKLKDSLLSFFIIIQLFIYHLADLIYIFISRVPGQNLDGILHVFSPNFFSVIILIVLGLLLLAANYQKMENNKQALVFIGWYVVIAITITLLLIMFELIIVTAISPVLIEYLKS